MAGVESHNVAVEYAAKAVVFVVWMAGIQFFRRGNFALKVKQKAMEMSRYMLILITRLQRQAWRKAYLLQSALTPRYFSAGGSHANVATQAATTFPDQKQLALPSYMAKIDK